MKKYGNCGLCGNFLELRNSHIISEMFYNEMLCLKSEKNVIINEMFQIIIFDDFISGFMSSQ